MIYMADRWKKAAVLVLLLLVTGLAYVGSSRAQLKKEEVDFEVLATVTAQKGQDCCLWNMAEKYYGNANEWEYIRKMNKIPNERAISVGTVIYIPVKDAKRLVKKAEADIEAKKVVEVDISSELEKLREELRLAKDRLEKCEAENKRLAEALKKSEAKNKKLAASLKKCEAEKKRLANELKKCKEAGAENKRLVEEVKKKDAIIEELEAELREMRRKAERAASREREEFEDAMRRKERRIRELEEELEDCRRARRKLEDMSYGVKEKVREAEKHMAPEHMMMKKPPAKPKKPADSRSRIAAVAIALVGSIIWIASD